jgi:hypothetical protein
MINKFTQSNVFSKSDIGEKAGEFSVLKGSCSSE